MKAHGSIVVVGGGPAGTVTASHLSKDHDVTVLEEHGVSGTPMHCTGIISEDVIGMSGVRPEIFERIIGADVFFPDGRCYPVRSKGTKAVVIDREDLDRKLAERAVDSGAEILYGRRYLSHASGEKEVTITTDDKDMKASLLIGADGQNSLTARSIQDNEPKEYVFGMQADIKARSEEDGIMCLRVGSEYAPGFFTWKIPMGDLTRVGLCSTQAGTPADLLKKLIRISGLEGKEIVSSYAGKIPLGGRRRSYGDRLLLVGDAAGQVKPISGGGLYPIMKAAPILADTARNAMSSGDLTAKNLSAYEKGWKKEIGKELSRGYRFRRMYTKLSDDDINRVYDIIDTDDVRKILDEIHLDSPSSIVMPILRHPGIAIRSVPLFLKAIL